MLKKARINAIGFKRTYNVEVRELGFQVKQTDFSVIYNNEE